MIQVMSFEESLIWRSILGSFFNWFFYFNHSTLSYYAFSFMIFITFFFIGLSWFHISSCRLVKLTRTFSNVFLLVFSSFFHFIVLFFFLYEVIPMSQPSHKFSILTRVSFFSLLKLFSFLICPSAFDLLVIKLHFFFFMRLYRSHLIFYLWSHKTVETF